MTTEPRKDKQVELPRSFNAEQVADRLYLNLDDVTVSQLAKSIDMMGERIASSITGGFAPLQKEFAAISTAITTQLPVIARTPVTSPGSSATDGGAAAAPAKSNRSEETASTAQSPVDASLTVSRDTNTSAVIAAAVAKFIGSVVNNLERQPKSTVDDFSFVNPYRGDAPPARQGDRITHKPEIKNTGVTNP